VPAEVEVLAVKVSAKVSAKMMAAGMMAAKVPQIEMVVPSRVSVCCSVVSAKVLGDVVVSTRGMTGRILRRFCQKPENAVRVLRVSAVVFAFGGGHVGSVVRVSTAVVFAYGGGHMAVGFFQSRRNDALFLETSPRAATFH
jgi:hypothetical protein